MDISALTLHQLRILHAVAGSGNITRAAEKLGISQPAVSVQIKHLEKLLGFPLIEVVGRSLKLTESGLLVDEHAVRILSEVDGLRDSALEIRGIERGTLKVGADTTVGIYVMPRLLGAWHRSHEHVEVDLRVGNHDTICTLLKNADVDLAVVSSIPNLPELEVREFLPNRLVVIAPADHPLSSETRISPEILRREPILVREGGSSTSAAFERFCRLSGLVPRVAMRLGSIGAIKQGVAGGLGLGVVSERAIENELAVGELVVLDVEGFPLELMWQVVHSRRMRLSPAARSFKAFLEADDSSLAALGQSRPASHL